jgi:acetoacetyl-[acyl-carrier protein] synthase
MLGDQAIQQRSWVQSHGSSTPQNRVTESAILDRVAGAFGISDWPVTAIKSYVGHSLAPASGDQLAATLGSFAHGLLPGIKTIDHVADDVLADRLSIPLKDVEREMDVAFINSKGFGGNNASAVVLSPDIVSRMLARRYGDAAMSQYGKRNESVMEQATAYHQQALRGELSPLYRFGENVIGDEDIDISAEAIRLRGFEQAVNLTPVNRYDDMF